MRHSSALIRILATAFGPVPGSNGHTAALIGMAVSVRGEIDMVTVKTDSLGHIERFGDARMFRVPVSGSTGEQRAAFARAVGRQLEAESYDVVHVRGPEEGVIAAAHRSVNRFLLIYEVATYPDEGEGAASEAAWEKMHRECLDAADLILVPTDAAARYLSTLGFAGKTAVITPGVDVNAFDWWPSSDGDLVRLLYLGSFGADRDLVTVLSVIRQLQPRLRIRALFAGDADARRRDQLQTMVDAFGLSKICSVHAEPRARSLPVVIAACNLGIVSASATPRFQEYGDLPEPLLEFLACRRPIIAAGVPGAAEVVRDEKEGLLYIPSEESTLVDAILALVTHEKLRAQIIAGGYERVRSAFSASARRRRIAEIYEMLVPGSQQFDVWHEAFQEPEHPVVTPPSTVFELPGHIETTTTIRPEMIPDSDSVPAPVRVSSPTDEMPMVRVETNPDHVEVTTDENDFPADKTTVHNPDGVT